MKFISRFIIIILVAFMLFVASHFYFILIGDPLVLPVAINNNYPELIYNIKLEPAGSVHEAIIIDKLESGKSRTVVFYSGYVVSGLKFSCKINDSKTIEWESPYLEGKSNSLTIYITITKNGGVNIEYSKTPFSFL